MNSGILAIGSKASASVRILGGFSPKWMGRNRTPGGTDTDTLAGTLEHQVIEQFDLPGLGDLVEQCIGAGLLVQR